MTDYRPVRCNSLEYRPRQRRGWGTNYGEGDGKVAVTVVRAVRLTGRFCQRNTGRILGTGAEEVGVQQSDERCMDGCEQRG